MIAINCHALDTIMTQATARPNLQVYTKVLRFMPDKHRHIEEEKDDEEFAVSLVFVMAATMLKAVFKNDGYDVNWTLCHQM